MEKGFTQDIGDSCFYICASGNIDCKFRTKIYVYKNEVAIPIDYCAKREFECDTQERKIVLNYTHKYKNCDVDLDDILKTMPDKKLRKTKVKAEGRG
jgi:hypothetical protein